LFTVQDEPYGKSLDFLYAALDTTACAAFIKESRMNFANANKFHRKSGLARPFCVYVAPILHLEEPEEIFKDDRD
jgi:hypothetical protein